MDLILNELSVNGLSPDPVALRSSIGKMMAMRNAAKTRAGVEVYCHRNVSNMAVSSGEAFRERLQTLPTNEKRAVFRWLNKNGPFWEDAPMQDSGEWYECDSELVTEMGLAEAAHYVENGIDWRTLSFAPSHWERLPITVTHRWEGEGDDGASLSQDIPVPNYWDIAKLEPALIQAQPDPKSWNELEDAVRRMFTSLNFAADSFSDLAGRPFSLGAAKEIRNRLSVLDRICADGPDSPEGKRLLADHFGGKRTWFSNSSQREINTLRERLVFTLNGGRVFAPWHGKINNPPYRIHFTWPVSDGKVHVVYVGWKRTV